MDGLYGGVRHARGRLRAAPLVEELESRLLLTTALTTFTSVASFKSTKTGSQAAGLVMDAGGDLFGVAGNGGSKNYGTVFEIVAGTSAILTLASFTGANGISPRGNLVIDSAGNLYGTTVGGGANLKGTIWEIAGATTGGTTITTLASFDGVNGSYPIQGIIADASGNFFGTTTGANISGYKSTVFELATGSSTITALATFSANSLLVGTVVVNNAGDVFGITARGGTKSDGTVFKIAAGSGVATTLASFNGTNGSTPDGTLLMDSAGSLIGLTRNGGAHNAGTIFKLFATSSTITTLASLAGSTGGSQPIGTLVIDGLGDIFGVTSLGGKNSGGTAFELPAGSGTVTSLFSFTGTTTGAFPSGALLLDGSGHLWGTTVQGGVNGNGLVFKLEPPTSDAIPPTPASVLRSTLKPTLGR